MARDTETPWWDAKATTLTYEDFLRHARRLKLGHNSERLLYLYLAHDKKLREVGGRKGRVWPTRRRLMELLGVTENTLDSCRKELISKRLIAPTDNQGGRTGAATVLIYYHTLLAEPVEQLLAEDAPDGVVEWLEHNQHQAHRAVIDALAAKFGAKLTWTEDGHCRLVREPWTCSLPFAAECARQTTWSWDLAPAWEKEWERLRGGGSRPDEHWEVAARWRTQDSVWELTITGSEQITREVCARAEAHGLWDPTGEYVEVHSRRPWWESCSDEDLQARLAHLSPKEREVIELRAVQELTWETCRMRMGSSAVGVRLRDAAKKLTDSGEVAPLYAFIREVVRRGLWHQQDANDAQTDE